MFRLIQLVLYTAAMLALGWLLWQIVPPAYDWLVSLFGSVPVFGMLFAVWAVGGFFVIREHRRHPEWSIGYQRQRSGKFLEPRDP